MGIPTNWRINMIKEKTVLFILEWIEKNLEQRITIDDITRLSGYSRRYIQLLFKKFTGKSMGDYIRRRRLCRAAILVRLTSMSMIDIATLLFFDSQQSFSREFKKLFGCSPRQYRERDYWDLSGICPPWLDSAVTLPQWGLVNMDEIRLKGNFFEYTDNLLGEFDKNGIRYNHILKHLRYYKRDIYCLSSVCPSTKNTDSINVKTFIGIPTEEFISEQNESVLVSNLGLYVFFHYSGLWKTYKSLVQRVYFEILPANGLAKTRSYDIELFHSININFEENESISCDH